MQMPLDVKEDETSPSLAEWIDFKECCEDYKDFQEVLRALRKVTKSYHVDLRYPNLALKEYPPGSVGDWLICVVNIFGEIAEEENDGKVKPIPRPRLQVKLAAEMNTSERTAKTWLNTLINGGYLKVDFGNIPFPAHLWRGSK
jgi:hypothetical protein